MSHLGPVYSLFFFLRSNFFQVVSMPSLPLELTPRRSTVPGCSAQPARSPRAWGRDTYSVFVLCLSSCREQRVVMCLWLSWSCKADIPGVKGHPASNSPPTALPAAWPAVLWKSCPGPLPCPQPSSCSPAQGPFTAYSSSLQPSSCSPPPAASED